MIVKLAPHRRGHRPCIGIYRRAPQYRVRVGTAPKGYTADEWFNDPNYLKWVEQEGKYIRALDRALQDLGGLWEMEAMIGGSRTIGDDYHLMDNLFKEYGIAIEPYPDWHRTITEFDCWEVRESIGVIDCGQWVWCMSSPPR